MKSKFIRIVNLIVAVAVFVLAIGYAFAWLAESRKEAEQNFNGSSGQTYFAGGDGLTKETAYIINDKYHLYNLSWLQNTGKIKDQNDQQIKCYFKLDADIEIADNNFWLPPIGTDSYPFIGEFDGNGHTISGLKITTDKSKLLGVPSDFNTFSNAVGMFGMTGPGSKISNFTLSEPKVEVASETNNNYNNAADGSLDKKKAGFAIGYVNGSASDIGIYNGKLAVNRQNYTTINSIIGDANPDIDTGDIDGSGGDTGQFIPDDFLDNVSKLSNIIGTKDKDAYPFNTDTWVLPYNEAVEEGQFTGIGLGSFSFVTGKDVTTLQEKEVNSFTYYKYCDGNNYTASADATQNIAVTLGDISDTEAGKISMKVLNGSTQISSLKSLIYFENSSVFRTGLKAVYETNDVLGTPTSVLSTSTVLSNSLKVRVKKSSTKIFVIASNRSKSDTRYLGVYKVSDSIAEFADRVTDSGYAETWPGADKHDPTYKLTLPANSDGNQVVACEFSLEGTGSGTYMLNSTNGGIQIHYVAVTGTTEGEEGGGDKLKNIDFVYKANDNTTLVAVNSEGFAKTFVTVHFDSKSITEAAYIYFLRANGGKDTDGSTLEVQYDTNSGIIITRTLGAGGKLKSVDNVTVAFP